MPVGDAVIAALIFAMAAERDDGFAPLAVYAVRGAISVISTVSQNFSRKGCGVALLPRCEYEADR